MHFLIHRLIPNADQVQDPAARTAYGKLSGVIGIVGNLLLFICKLIGGILTGSLSIMADAANNLSDASSSIISLLGFHLASRPADDDHPFGHGRYEYLSGLLVSFLVLLIGFELLKSSVGKILHPTEVTFRWIAVILLIVSILIKVWMMAINHKIGVTIHSQTLIATATDSRNDAISTTAVLAATLISQYTPLHLDGWMGLAVALFILYSGLELVKDTLDPLLGTTPDPVLVQEIHDRIIAYPGVLGTHDLILHDYGPGRQFASVHVEMAAENDVLVSHDVIDNIEHDLQKQLGIHIIVHFDPISTTSPITADLRSWIAEEIKQIDHRLTIHDLRIVPGPSHTNIIFDCLAPQSLAMSNSVLASTIATLLQKKDPSYRIFITVDRSYVAIPDAL